MMAINDFVALPFVLADDGTIVAGGPIECASAGTAILRAEVLSRSNVGAVAFSRTGDSDIGIFEEAVVLRKFGEVPTDLTIWS
jgi:hypothetical protein